MRKEKLDFIIIGAQKAGTTSLAEHLNNTPDVYIPPEKEIPYFVEPLMLQRGWKWYLDTFFKNADPARAWGTSTPQYMMHPECFQSIKAALPDVKIILTLRDPVQRLVSHFDMMTRLGIEKRTLRAAVEEQISQAEQCRATAFPDHAGKYVSSGEYGRILEELFQHFPADQVLVLFFDDIVRDVQGELDQLCGFIGVPRFAASDPGRVRMQGGTKKKVPLNHDKLIAAAATVARRLGIAGMIPDRLKARVGRIASWLDENNVDPGSKTRLSSLPPDIVQALREHYAEDAAILRKLGISPPWLQPASSIQQQ